MRNQSEAPNLAATKTPISQEALDQLFRRARTHSTWLPEPVPVELLRKAYELARLGPTSANGSPARFVFLTTPGAKARLQPALAPGNVDKTIAAPVTVIVAWDTEFHENLPRLFPQADVRSYFVGNKPLIQETAFRNSSLQAAYFILAPRFGVRLRTDVRFRRRQTECGILS
jgi:3-hydroxypropanoate dehydrogenase